MASNIMTPPNVNFLSGLLESLSLNNFDVGSSHWVYVTHINDPNDFFIRLTSHDTYFPEIETKGESLCPHEVILGLGVIYESKKLNTYVRGKITFIHDSEFIYNILAVDYGWIEKDVPLQNVCKPYYDCPIPPLAIACTLTLCYPRIGTNWPEDSIEAMKFYVGNEIAKIVVKCKIFNKLEVELVNSSPSEIGTLLALTGYSQLTSALVDMSRFCAPVQLPKYEYKFMKPKIGDVLHVRLQKKTETNEFYVAKVDDYKTYIRNRNELHQYAKHQKSISLAEASVGLPVAVLSQIDFRYERGVIMNIESENSVDICYVDWGHVVNVDVSTLKPITFEKYLTDPPIALKCSPFEDKDMNMIYKTRMMGTEFIITIKDIIGGFQDMYVVSLLPK